MNFVPVVGPPGSELDRNQIHNFLSGKIMISYSGLKVEEYMESKLFGIFWVKVVTKNIAGHDFGNFAVIMGNHISFGEHLITTLKVSQLGLVWFVCFFLWLTDGSSNQNHSHSPRNPTYI